MAEKKKRGPSGMFLRWSLSYLIISVIALLLILFSGFRYTAVLRENLEYTNGIQLDMTCVWLDQKLGLLRNITARESLDSSITKIRNATDYDTTPKFSYYLLTKEVATDLISFGIEDPYFLYFPATDAMVSNAYYGQSQRYYELRLEPFGIPYEEWMGILAQDYATTQVFKPEQSDDTNYLILVRPLNINSTKGNKVNAVMLVDLDELIQASDWLNKDTLCIVDRNHNKIISNAELPDPVIQAILDRIAAVGSRKIITAEHMVVDGHYIAIISSDYENWDLAVIMQERTFASRILDVQKLILVVVLVYLVLTALVISNTAVKRYGKLRRVVNVLAKENHTPPELMTDAYAYIDSNVQKLVQANVENADLIARQQDAIARELFHSIMTSTNASADVDLEHLEKAGFPVRPDQTYYLLAYRLDERNWANEPNPEKTREMEWFILKNVTEETLSDKELHDLCFREGETQIYIVWSDAQGTQTLGNIEWAWRYCQTFLAQHFDFAYTVAISEEHSGVDGVNKAYREIRQVYHYQRKQKDPATVHYSQLNLLPGETMVQYPGEADNRLTLAVRSGDEASACAEIHKVMERNAQNYLSPAAMQFLASKMMASIVRGAEEMAGDAAIVESQNQVMEAAGREEQEQIERSLCNLAKVVCERLGKRNRQVQEDEKGQLYIKIKDYIDENYPDPGLNVNSVSEYFGKQPSFVSRYFKEMSGTNLTQYIHKIRLQHVKEKLLRGDRLEDIALSCGFGSQRSFLRIFKQYEGVTPSQYKELHSSKDEAMINETI
ncbi:helix-turn-helix transcriptional regulator [Gemmiger sp.]|uniref:helix-turn-helix transcriptional regulator n=1 Tax=Gemmiger sp. TaxID=2049027 RepID=UPI003F019376